jgi:hypothetical protein
MNKTTPHACAERFPCMTAAVDELTRRFPGLTRQQASHIVWELDMGPIGSDRGIWLDPAKVAVKAGTWLSGQLA